MTPLSRWDRWWADYGWLVRLALWVLLASGTVTAVILWR